MTFFSRVSDSIWAFVSPVKTPAKETTQTLPKCHKSVKDGRRRRSIEDVKTHDGSMSHVEKIASWRISSPSQTSDLHSSSKKRKRLSTRDIAAGRREKLVKMQYANFVDHEELENNSDVDMDEEEYEAEQSEEEESGADSNEDRGVETASDSDVCMEDQEYEQKDAKDEEVESASDDDDDDDDNQDGIDEVSSNLSNINVAGSELQSDYDYDEYGTPVLSDEAYNECSPRKKLISPTTEMFAHGISTDEMRADGWPDEHIALVSKLTMRGYEPLLPHFWKLDYRNFPDQLFEADDNSFINTLCNKHLRAIKAFNSLLELGGRVRSRAEAYKGLNSYKTPEIQAQNYLKAYVKWANKDCDLDLKTTIPLLTIIARPLTYSSEAMTALATKRLAKLASRYKEAFSILQSIEASPSPSTASTILSNPLPTLYALACSHQVIALAAYNPNHENPGLKMVAIFDLSEIRHDVWNAFAMAILVCHCRKVQTRIAEETGLGMKVPGMEVEEECEDL